MLKANEANRISNGSQNRVKQEVLFYLEKAIIANAEDGFKWLCWNYRYSTNFTAHDKQEIIFELRSCGYDVKDSWTAKEILIRW